MGFSRKKRQKKVKATSFLFRRSKLFSSKDMPFKAERRAIVSAFVFGSVFGIVATLIFVLVLKNKEKYSVPRATLTADFTLPILKDEPKPEPMLSLSFTASPASAPVFTSQSAPNDISMSDFVPEEKTKESATVHEEAEETEIPLPPAPAMAPTSPSDTSAETQEQPATAKPLPLLNNWEKYMVKVGKLPAKAIVVAVIIDDLGIDKKRTGKIVNLPAPLTASFITYASGLKEQIASARKTGKEIMLHIPMEAHSSVDSGPNVLTTTMTAQEIKQTLKQHLNDDILASGVVGVNNHMGSKFTQDAKSMRFFMEAYSPYGLIFVDSRTAQGSAALPAARSAGIRSVGRNVFLDNQEDTTYITKQLQRLEKTARKNGYAIGIAHHHDATIEALSAWLKTLDGKGIYLVPVSYIIKEKL